MLCVRAEATSRARPTPASQAERVRIVSGRMNEEVFELSADIVKAMKIDSIIPSRHSSVESRCVWCMIRPMVQMTKEYKNMTLMDVII